MDNKIIEVNNLTKKFGTLKALDTINLNINKGEIFALVGPNAAGKSTFISIITGLVKPTNGDVVINGYSVSKQSVKVKSIMGYVPQDIALYPTLTAFDNLCFWAGIYGLKGDLRKKRVNQVLSIVRLENRAHQKVMEYSGGMKRRLNIAVALVHKPEIIVMDEPVVGVDILSKKYIIDALKNLKKEGCTIIITSHYINELAEFCDRMALLDDGSIKITGTVNEILDTYKKKDIEQVMISVFKN